MLQNVDRNVSAAAVDALGTITGINGAQVAAGGGRILASAAGASSGAITSGSLAYADGKARGTDNRTVAKAMQDIAVSGAVSMLTGAPGGVSRSNEMARVAQEGAEVILDVTGGAVQQFANEGRVTTDGAISSALARIFHQTS